jgi:hypothetical protein
MLHLKNSLMRCASAAFLIGAFYVHASGPVRSTDFPSFKLLPGATDSDGLPTAGAKLCLAKPARACFQMPSKKDETSASVVYEFGLSPLSERLPLPGGGSFILFSSEFSGGGSGTLNRLAILRFELNGKIVNLLPFVGVTNQSEHAVWQIPAASSFPVLVIADFYWMDGETHFSDHLYTVTAYRFSADKDCYVEALSYRTSKKYRGLDKVDQVHVLNSERAEILRRLEAAPTNM